MILDDIVKQVRQRVEERKGRISLQNLEACAGEQAPALDFVGAIRRGEHGRLRVIAEVKKASPSKGLIRPDFDPIQIAREYERHGASAVSVLTEEDFFLGHPEFLRQIREAVRIPLLRKDFILEPYQVMEARALGADAFLLIVSLLADEELEKLILLGERLGMAALVEVHSKEELDRSEKLPVRMIGINNRDLKSFVTDLGTTFRLMEEVPEDCVIVSESGVAAPEDLKRLDRAGVDAVLVGETLMRSPSPGEKLVELLHY